MVTGLVTAAVLACDSPADPGVSVDTGVHLSVVTLGGLHFMTQDVDPPILMEALYQGEVSTDAAGCIKLTGPDPATVIWPKDFGVRVQGDGVRVLRPDGSELGPLGGAFVFGGGFVQDLHDGLGFSVLDRALARERCPGAYWIVGDVPTQGDGG